MDHVKKKRVQFEEVSERTMKIPDENEEIDEVDVEQINKAIRSLPDGYRTVLSLYLIEGYDHDEISEILGISNAASRTQFSRAKSKLREMLKGKEIFSYN
ncbi:MAG: sigma-70 family RNA polymerase sigma factor [Mariniphaga sp.]|nr:sigma-70 family RNA polymerase sigma factor [Mariniphaga sp.]